MKSSRIWGSGCGKLVIIFIRANDTTLYRKATRLLIYSETVSHSSMVKLTLTSASAFLHTDLQHRIMYLMEAHHE